MRIALLGLAGAGKGIQGKRLSLRFGVPHFSLGDYLRLERTRDTELGELLRARGGWGVLPDHLGVKATEEMLKEHSAWILDGFPRTAVQATSAIARSIDVGIYFRVSEAVARERVLSRGREGDSLEKYERRLQVEQERLPELLKIVRSNWWLIEVDADQSPDTVEASIWQSLCRGGYGER